MDDIEFKSIVLESLKNLEVQLNEKHEKLHDKVDRIVISSAIQAKDIEQIKIDLYEHKEGVIQNRARIELLEDTQGEQIQEVHDHMKSLDEKFTPCLDWIEKKKEFPKKLMIHTSKVLAALAALSAVGTGIFKVVAWAISYFKF